MAPTSTVLILPFAEKVRFSDGAIRLPRFYRKPPYHVLYLAGSSAALRSFLAKKGKNRLSHARALTWDDTTIVECRTQRVKGIKSKLPSPLPSLCYQSWSNLARLLLLASPMHGLSLQYCQGTRRRSNRISRAEFLARIGKCS